MRRSIQPLSFCAAVVAAVAASFAAEPVNTLTVQTDQPGHRVPASLYGVFFEEINRAGDGGVYAELLPNRSFEDTTTPSSWTTLSEKDAQGTVSIDASGEPLSFNRRALKIDATDAADGRRFGVATEGFKGLAIQSGAAYTLTVHFRSKNLNGRPLIASLERRDGTNVVSFDVPTTGDDWQTQTVRLTPGESVADARFVLSVAGPGTVWVDHVSLFPVDTYKGRPGGLRTDLVDMMAALKPAFFRFPGGCWVEGETMSGAYQWKQTVGPVMQRRTQRNLWNYQSTNGLGYHEYLQLCEDLNADAMYVVNAGMSHKENVAMNRMGDWVQDALDAVEYAVGPADSTWGAMRAKAGHPEPFKLKYLEIGNENGGPAYDERYALFYDAMKAKFPDVQLIAGEWHGRPKSRPIEILDEHYYNTPGWFVANADRYDKYDRNGPKIYVGEYAVTRGNVGQGNLAAAVGEAAFMTGMERNSDVVVMASYAPLFANVHYKAWNPNAINFDASRVYGTPSYYVQKMFATNRPDLMLPVKVASAIDETKRHGTVGVGTWRTQSEYKDIQVVAADGNVLLHSSSGDALKPVTGQWAVADGALRQTGPSEGAVALADLPADAATYTLTLKARKTGGDEGFMVRFHSIDRDTFSAWNIGGWENSRHGLQVAEGGPASEIGRSPEGKIETGRWYDLKIEARPDGAKCYLDGQLVHDVTYGRTRSLYATAGRAGNDVVVKVVNPTNRAQETAVSLAGLTSTATSGATARVTTLTHADAKAENTLAEPTKVTPVESEMKLDGGAATVAFPANSVTILRVTATQ